MLSKRSVVILLCLIFSIVGCIQVLQRPRVIETRISKEEAFRRGLWVRAASMAAPEAIDRIMALSLDMGILGLFHAAEGEARDGCGDADVDANHPRQGLELELPGIVAVLGVDGGAVAVLVVVDDLNRFVEGVGLQDDDHRTE